MTNTHRLITTVQYLHKYICKGIINRQYGKTKILSFIISYHKVPYFIPIPNFNMDRKESIENLNPQINLPINSLRFDHMT